VGNPRCSNERATEARLDWTYWLGCSHPTIRHRLQIITHSLPWHWKQGLLFTIASSANVLQAPQTQRKRSANAPQTQRKRSANAAQTHRKRTANEATGEPVCGRFGLLSSYEEKYTNNRARVLKIKSEGPLLLALL